MRNICICIYQIFVHKNHFDHYNCHFYYSSLEYNTHDVCGHTVCIRIGKNNHIQVILVSLVFNYNSYTNIYINNIIMEYLFKWCIELMRMVIVVIL